VIEDIELARLLKLYPILKELPARLQHAFYNSGYSVRRKAGEIVYDTARPSLFFLLLTSGSMRVIHLGQEREILLYKVKPGEACMLTICHLLAGMQYHVRAFAEQPITGVALPQDLFVQFVEGSPLFSLYLFRSFSSQLEVLLALVEAVSFRQLDQRLAGLLLSKGDMIQITHSQLADELGSVREVISRILKDFERGGLLQLERGRIRILDQLSLANIAASFDEKGG
jgi:CRP/FNR family transcriptional regulator